MHPASTLVSMSVSIRVSEILTPLGRNRWNTEPRFCGAKRPRTLSTGAGSYDWNSRRPYHRNHSKRQDVFVWLTGESCPAAVDLSSLDLKHMVVKNVMLAVQSSKRQVILKTCSRKALISGLSINQLVTSRQNVCIRGQLDRICETEPGEVEERMAEAYGAFD